MTIVAYGYGIAPAVVLPPTIVGGDGLVVELMADPDIVLSDETVILALEDDTVFITVEDDIEVEVE